MLSAYTERSAGALEHSDEHSREGCRSIECAIVAALAIEPANSKETAMKRRNGPVTTITPADIAELKRLREENAALKGATGGTDDRPALGIRRSDRSGWLMLNPGADRKARCNIPVEAFAGVLALVKSGELLKALSNPESVQEIHVETAEEFAKRTGRSA
jgi:hypothetical protein